MTGNLLLALWIGLGAIAAAAETADMPGAQMNGVGYSPLSQAQAGAFYEATHFSLDQVGAQHLLHGMDRDTFVEALVAHHAKAPQAERAALQRLHLRWGKVRSDWQVLSLSDRRSFVYDVIAVAYGRAIAGELVTDDTFTNLPRVPATVAGPGRASAVSDASLAGH